MIVAIFLPVRGHRRFTVPTKLLLPELPTRLQKLIEERQVHADALARIDQVLSSIGAAMGATIANLPAHKAVTVPAATPASVAKTRKRRKQGKFATSGEESILAFVKGNKHPTTQEIKKLWKS